MTKRSLLVAVGLLALIATPLAAGMFSNYPTVGVAAHCASTNQANTTVPTGSTNCTTTIPAGPPSVTGLETVPADTNAAQGQPPQTVNLSMAALNALPVTVAATAANGVNTKVAAATEGGFILTHTGTITSLTLTLPPSPKNGQQFALSANQTVTTVSVGGSGSDTVDSAPTVITRSTTAAYGYRFMYNLAATKWYRLQ